MNKFKFLISVITLIFIIGLSKVHAGDESMNVNDFGKLYDQLLAGKTLVTETKGEDGTVVRKESRFGNSLDVGVGEFDIPVTTVITKSKDGKLQQRIIIEILDHVNELGGTTIVSEEVRKTTVESSGEEPRTTREVEFGGVFRVSKNDKGGFDVQNFGLAPSVLVDGDKMGLAGSMLSFSCFPEGSVTKCVSTVRDYKLGEYKPLEGYALIEPAGGDMVEVSVEAKQ